MSKKSWLQANTNSGKGKYAIIKGKAYPNVLKGKQPTKITATAHDIRKLWRDPAVKLSDDNLDDIDGAVGAPLCFGHDDDAVVGEVRHTWIDEEEGRCLKMWGRIPLDDRGKEIVEDIKSGKIKGLSVSYNTDTRGDEVTGKTFKHIALVPEPFFDGCNLTLGVMASGASLVAEDQFFVPIEMSNNEGAAAPAPSGQTHSAAATPAAATPASQSVFSDTAREAGDVLKQADALRQRLDETSKIADEQKRAAEEKDQLNAQLKEELAAFAESYRKDQEPKYQEFIAGMEASLGKPLDEATKKRYYSAFTQRRFKDDADILWNKHMNDKNKQIEITASRDAAEKRQKALEEELAATKATLAKASQHMAMGGGMRAGYANSLAMRHQDEAMTPAQSEAAKAIEDASRKQIGVNASRSSLHLNKIMCAHPSAAELPFLREFGYSDQIQVNASAASNNGEVVRPFLEAVDPAPTHKMMRDPETRDYNHPASARYVNPPLFAWMVNHSGLREETDLSGYVNFNTARTFVEEKRVDDFKHTATPVGIRE